MKSFVGLMAGVLFGGAALTTLMIWSHGWMTALFVLCGASESIAGMFAAYVWLGTLCAAGISLSVRFSDRRWPWEHRA